MRTPHSDPLDWQGKNEMFSVDCQFSFEALHSSLFRNTIGYLVTVSNVNKFILRHCFERHHTGHYSDNGQLAICMWKATPNLSEWHSLSA